MPFDDTSFFLPPLPPKKQPIPKGFWAPRDEGCQKACCLDSFIGKGDACDSCGLREDGTFD